MARDYVKQREDVQNLQLEVEKLTKKQQVYFSAVTTSGDKFAGLVMQAKLLAQELGESGKYSKNNNDLAENQAKAAKIGLMMGKRQGIINKFKIAYAKEELRQTRAKQDMEDDVTDAMLDQIDAQEEGLDVAGKLNAAADAADSLFGGMGSTIRDFVTNPLTGIIGILTSFASMTDEIGKSFGAIGVSKYRDDLAQANIEFTKMGLKSVDLMQSIDALCNEF